MAWQSAFSAGRPQLGGWVEFSFAGARCLGPRHAAAGTRAGRASSMNAATCVMASSGTTSTGIA